MHLENERNIYGKCAWKKKGISKGNARGKKKGISKGIARGKRKEYIREMHVQEERKEL